MENTFSLKDYDTNNEYPIWALEEFFALFNLGIGLKEIAFRMGVNYNDIHRMFRILKLRHGKNYSDLPNERWIRLDKVGYPLYFVSSCGRIRRGTYVKKPRLNDRGYHDINLYRPGSYHTKTIHRLVLMAFTDDYSTNLTVNHIDYNRNNNHLENLEWATMVEQMAHRDKVPGRKEASSARVSGSRNPMAKLSEDIVRAIRSKANEHLSNRELGDKFGISDERARVIRKRECWKHI